MKGEGAELPNSPLRVPGLGSSLQPHPPGPAGVGSDPPRTRQNSSGTIPAGMFSRAGAQPGLGGAGR